MYKLYNVLKVQTLHTVGSLMFDSCQGKLNLISFVLNDKTVIGVMGEEIKCQMAVMLFFNLLN